MEEKDIKNQLVRTNIILTIALILLGLLGLKHIIDTDKTTRALANVAYRTCVDLPLETNNVLGVWQVVKPK